MSPKLRTLIVDDEALARKVLSDYVDKLPVLQKVGECPDAISTLEFLNNGAVDLLLLDINMPELSGLEMLATLQRPPKVILTTAYADFALESYEYGVVDYLLKPISFARFLKAVNRVVGTAAGADNGHFEVQNGKSLAAPALAYLEFKHDGMPLQLPLSQLLYVKSFGNYLRLVTHEKTYTILETLTKMEDRLPRTFQRVHKSYIVNAKRISGLTGGVISVGEREVPLSPMYKLMLLEKLKEQNV